MSGPEASRSPEDRLLQEAAEWFAHMRGPEAEASRSAFEAWLARGALHRAAYNRAAETFALGKLLSDEGAGKDRRRNRLAAGVIGALLALSVGTWAALQTPAGNESQRSRMAKNDINHEAVLRTLSTAPNETRTFLLADGSRVTLRTDTLVGVDLNRSARRLTLARGQARFQVARGSRPFIVYAGGGRVTARGTVFDVGFSRDRQVTVRLIEGVVEVALPTSREATSPQATPRRLSSGETMSFTAQREAAAEARATPPDEEPAAPATPPEYDGIRVAELIAAANLSASRPIRLGNPAIGERRVSGRFRIDDAGLLAERVAAVFDLAVDRSNPAEIVLRPR